MIYTLIRNKELAYFNPFFIFVAFLFLYMVIPSFFATEIRQYYKWQFTDLDLTYSNILISNFLLIFSTLLIIFNIVKLRSQKTNYYKVSAFIKIIWTIVYSYLLYILIHKYQTGNLIFNDQYYLGNDHSYKLKNIAYAFVTISILYYTSINRFFVFIPLLLIVFIDIISGSRTTAFIALVPIFLTYSIKKSKTYILPILGFIFFLSLIGILRDSSSVSIQGIPFYIKMMGEFRETYLTTPIIISDSSVIGHGDIFSFSTSFFVTFLHPYRDVLASEFTLPGPYIANEVIRRGYGLGCNFITDSLYYGYFFIFVTMFCLIFVFYIIYTIIQKIPFNYSLIFASYSIIFIRQIIRGGLYANVGLMVFVLLFYSIPFITINYLSFRSKTISHYHAETNANR